MNRPEFRLSVLALIVAVATGAFTYLQYRVADHTRQEMHDDSMQNLKLSHRPYVGVKAILSPNMKYKGVKGTEITMQFTVSGDSPALDMQFRKGCRMFDNIATVVGGKPPSELGEYVKPALPHGVLFPEQTISLHCVTLGGNVSGPVFVEGDVTYTDVFGQRHKTGFCFYNYQPKGKDVEDMYPCTEGNTME